jgi:Fe-S-cluster containining protein
MRVDRMLKKFTCRKCGRCCKAEGILPFTQEDVYRIARRFQLPYAVVRRIFFTATGHHYELKTPEQGACIFLHKHKCTIYSARPQVCRTFPAFWHRDDVDCQARQGETLHKINVCLENTWGKEWGHGIRHYDLELYDANIGHDEPLETNSL